MMEHCIAGLMNKEWSDIDVALVSPAFTGPR